MHQRPRISVRLHSFFRGNKHRHARAVLGRVEDLLDLVLLRRERHLRFGKDFGLPGLHIVVIDRRWNDERFERIESVLRIVESVNARG